MSKKLMVGFFAFLSVACIVFAGTFWLTPTTAQRSVVTRYEYAVINGSFVPFVQEGPGNVSAIVNICYLQAAGCQNEENRTDVNIAKFLQDERIENSSRGRSLAQERAIQVGFAKAISKLGADGWEMIAAPSIEFDLFYVNQQGTPTAKEGLRTERQHVWFRRVRQ